MSKITIIILACGLFSLHGKTQQLQCGSYSDFDSKFNNVGEFHNAHLTNILNNFLVPDNIKDYETAVNTIKGFNVDFSLKTQVSITGIVLNQEETKKNFELYKYFVNEYDFKEKLFSGESQFSLDYCLKNIASLPIDEGSKNLLKDISDLIRQSSLGKLTSNEFENSLVRLANTWLKKDEDKLMDGRYLTGCILAIGLKSCEWWKNHPEAKAALMGNQDEIERRGPNGEYFESYDFVFPWLLDLAGAIVGATINTINQQLSNNGNINGGQVAVAAGTGAILASGGIVGKVRNWIRNLF